MKKFSKMPKPMQVKQNIISVTGRQLTKKEIDSWIDEHGVYNPFQKHEVIYYIS